MAELKKKGIEINEQGFYNYRNLWKKSKSENGSAAASGGTAAPKGTASSVQKNDALPSASKPTDGTRILATLQKLGGASGGLGGYEELKKLIDFLEK